MFAPVNNRLSKLTCFALLIACCSWPSIASANQVEVRVLDADGNPVAGIAVYLESAAPTSLHPPATYAVMDQVDARFDPHVLIVQTGTEVRFPNSDVVAHHVYSFSNPNDFILPLYKGNAHPPVTFDESGVVTLGCNIHDEMLGYILIVDSDAFAMTDESGVAMLPVSDPRFNTVHVWSPRISSKDELLSQEIPASLPGQVTFRFREKLRPPHASQSSALKWSDY